MLCAPLDGPATLVAYDVNTGALGWSTVLTGQYFFTGAPTVADGMIYIDGAKSGNTIYAVNQITGTLVWTQNVDGSNRTLRSRLMAFMYHSRVEATICARLPGRQSGKLNLCVLAAAAECR